jgi:protein-tyrosine phosphatase
MTRVGGGDGGEAGLLGYLRTIGCGFQGNLGSFVGLYGEGVRRVALAHLASGLYTHYGSDAHRPEGVDRWLAAGLAAVSEKAGAGK